MADEIIHGVDVGLKVTPSDVGWYWARDRYTLQLAGVGKFMRPEPEAGGGHGWTFWINGRPYNCGRFEFLPADVPAEIDTVRPRVPGGAA